MMSPDQEARNIARLRELLVGKPIARIDSPEVEECIFKVTTPETEFHILATDLGWMIVRERDLAGGLVLCPDVRDVFYEIQEYLPDADWDDLVEKRSILRCIEGLPEGVLGFETCSGEKPSLSWRFTVATAEQSLWASRLRTPEDRQALLNEMQETMRLPKPEAPDETG